MKHRKNACSIYLNTIGQKQIFVLHKICCQIKYLKNQLVMTLWHLLMVYIPLSLQDAWKKNKKTKPDNFKIEHFYQNTLHCQ